ncbi:hypothetical protein TARUN_9209 [Trichoderma arundinaceum]|uniref:Uncharacterized protein n=1 Tax=Trichoderma arundinaceum TaxID=490622 RepID=A0A395NAB5_TRIAR|nr:hypothetical protein TARUN_9209 [Trichoderma arundinaceum]
MTRNEVAGEMGTRRCQARGRGRKTRMRERERARATIKQPEALARSSGCRPPGQGGTRFGNALGNGLFARVLDGDSRCQQGPSRGGDGIVEKRRSGRGTRTQQSAVEAAASLSLHLKADGGSTKQPAAVLRAPCPVLGTGYWRGESTSKMQGLGAKNRNPKSRTASFSVIQGHGAEER